MMSPGAKAALTLWVSAIVWDLVCPRRNTICEAFARGLRDPHTRLPISVGIGMTVAHMYALAAIPRTPK